MTKMAAMPIYGQNFERYLSSKPEVRNFFILKLVMDHLGLNVYDLYVNGDPGLTLVCLQQGQTWSNLVKIANCA